MLNAVAEVKLQAHKIPVIALAGNPNAGKTALFNAITGARQHVGNWPGVTVEKKKGLCPWTATRPSLLTFLDLCL